MNFDAISAQEDSRPVPISLPCGKVAHVSECDLRRVRLLSWSDRGGGYVRARFKKSAGGDGRFVYLHRFVLAAPAGYDVDHIDRNPLNNTRENLQIVTHSRNIMRAHIATGGVSKHRHKWRARIRIDGKSVSLGCYDSEQAARKVVKRARAEAWRDQAHDPFATVHGG